MQFRNPVGRHFLKSVLHHVIVLLVPRHGLLACVLHVGLQYDMMKLIKLVNAENKVSNEDKRENTYSLLLLKEGQ